MAHSATTAHGGPGPTAHGGPGEDRTRRDFLLYATSAVGVAGTALALWPFIDSMNPAADVLALSSSEVDLAPIAEGQSVTVTWRGKPVFIRHRTAEEIKAARDVNPGEMPDPQKDEDRVQKPEWLVLVGVCTHLGCIPLGQKPTDMKGQFGGWFCPCHGSHYDTSGRIRLGPAPANLAVPSYTFQSDTTIRIG
ncbi:MAG: ubiquinol-cytochrome c reductase iron-sulfur subunit [Alphaproteobacteria bacterium]|nr:ubiquinol-cytochrome c reductase iron-sulfur subunit [Alphaproteobacteria bacterium]MBF0128519.1 ubiquinol-cytochrome c reductase iron-sulfur subunit [Alphaproteobacteria bacterium]